MVERVGEGGGKGENECNGEGMVGKGMVEGRGKEVGRHTLPRTCRYDTTTNNPPLTIIQIFPFQLSTSSLPFSVLLPKTHS